MNANHAIIRRVYAYVAYRIGDGPEAEDVTSDVFERALRYHERFDPRRGDATAWLIGIARRCIADAVSNRLDLVDDIPEQGVPDHAELAVERAALRVAVARLAERDRELIALRYGADLSARQIGGLLDMRTNAVEVALHRALKTLRAAMETNDATPPPAHGVRWATEPHT
jgi:RNA polymerase sigma-70 factor (ECF subfamily)